MGGRDCFVGSSQGNPERRVPRAQQYTRSAEHQCRGIILSAAEEVAVSETLRLRCCQGVRGRVTRPSLRQNLC